MLPGTILRPEGFPKLADLVGHSARVQDTRKAARDLPHNLLKSKAGSLSFSSFGEYEYASKTE